jgi:2-polyprenyl-3-methyl-5-hydroxy-6-metoxy-1,4-benzoquinol methylase
MRRRPHLAERMDDPACDLARLHRTYAQFAPLNQLVSGWTTAWDRVVGPAARRAAGERGVARILDVGSGGGDLARQLAGWAARDGVPVEIVGIDPDPRALAYARSRRSPPNVRFEGVDLASLAADGARLDIVTSNHVLHHLPDDELRAFLRASRAVAREAVLHSDIHRSRWAIPAFGALTLPFRDSFIREDGFVSIRRAWRPDELEPHLPPGLRAERAGTFRLWVTGGPIP